MAKIWFRVGMEAEVSEEELDVLKNGKYREAEALMEKIIERGKLSGETYIPGKYNGCEDYDNPEDEVNFLF